MHHVAESVPKSKRDVIKETKREQIKKTTEVEETSSDSDMITSTFRRQHNTYTEGLR